MEEKKCLYKHKERFLRWKAKPDGRFLKISDENQKIVFDFLTDMELGQNIAKGTKKGARGYARINGVKNKLIFLVDLCEKKFYVDDIRDISEKDVLSLFAQMRSGEISKQNGKPYKAVSDYAKDFKAFWHWHIKKSKKEGEQVFDITEDLDMTRNKSCWVYLEEEEIERLILNANFKYKTIMLFLIDTGMRAPTELANIRISDFSEDFNLVEVREATSKTFGRQIKLNFSRNFVLEYIRQNDLKENDYLFQFSPTVANRYLKRLAKRIFGDSISAGGEKYCNLTLYDFRHNSACFWEAKKQEREILYQFGWSNSNIFRRYTDFLGILKKVRNEARGEENNHENKILVYNNPEEKNIFSNQTSHTQPQDFYPRQDMEQFQKQFILMMSKLMNNPMAQNQPLQITM